MTQLIPLIPLGALLALTGCANNKMSSGADTGSAYGTSSQADVGETEYIAPPDDEPPLEDTAEPEDTGQDTAEDTAAPDECDDTTAVTLYLSPDDSNSMSSPVQAREAVLDGWSSLSSVPIRTWEFLNYYSFDYAPAEADLLRVSASMLGDGGEYTLQIGVSSAALSSADRLPMNITLVLDESGSMTGLAMSMQKAASEAIAGSLKAGDLVSVVTWDTSNAIQLDSHTISGPDDPTLMAVIDGLTAGGGTDLNGGLAAGYALAQDNFNSERINRVVLMSDGGANAGVTDITLIANAAAGNGGDGVYLVGVGVGEASDYNDTLMDEVTDAGKGASVFIPDAAEAQKIFGDRFVSTMDVAAKDVQVRLDLPPGFEIVAFSGEEYSGDPAEVEPQHIAPNDSVVFYQTLSTCAPGDVTDDTEITVTARYLDPRTGEPGEVSRTFTVAELADSDAAVMAKGASVFRYAEALKLYAAGSEDMAHGPLNEVLGDVIDAQALSPGDAELVEIREVVEALLTRY